MKLLAILTFFCFIETSYAGHIPVVDFRTFEPRLHMANDTTYIINFWASWCVPCVEELPEFEKFHQTYKSEKIKVLLVSLDFPDHINTRLIPFLERNKISAEVCLLDDPDFNSWIGKVDNSWGGGIPATIVYNKDSRVFINRKTNFKELESIVKPTL